jgi:2-oxoglutarate dehydrogenase E2 component (dihydrolipoamide succinyltransferase)
MTTEIKVPSLGESITEATVGQWLKKPGDAVKVDEPLVELETEKATVEVPSPVAGVLADTKVARGATVAIGAVLGSIEEGARAATSKPAAAPEPPPQPPRPEPVRAQPAAAVSTPQARSAPAPSEMPPSPAARKLMQEQGLSANEVSGSGRRGQVLKGDVLGAAEQHTPSGNGQDAGRPSQTAPVPAPLPRMRAPSSPNDTAREERMPMSRLRQTIARRLKDAQNTAAMLTTFNDVDMSAVMKLRTDYKDLFEKRHGVKLGFMGFFVKASVQALREVPVVNAEIDGGDIVYKNYYHIGVAVSTDKGLVVPVIREADRMSLAEIESHIADFAKRARDGKLSIDEMQGGTFTITNGGVFGSLVSTPILNAPQSGILGMHRIEERPVVRNGEVVARPMMYLALSYDHRLVDGRDAVTFLVRVKEYLEDPQRFLLEL